MFKIKTHHILFLVVFVSYLWLPNKDQGFDSYSYALDIRAGNDLFHPHHLLYSYFANLIYRIFSFTGLDCLRLLSIVNSLLAAIIICLVFLTLRKRQNVVVSIVGSITIALLYSFWYYATSLEVNLPALLFLILGLYWYLVKPESTSKNFISYVFLAIAALFHQIVILAFIPLTVYLLFRKHSIKRIILYLAVSAIFVLGAYLLIGLGQLEQKTFGDFYYWLTFYSHLGTWGKLSVSNITISAWGIIKTFTGGETLRELIYGGKLYIVHYIYIIAIAAFASVYLFNLITSFRIGFQHAKDHTWLILSMIAVFAIFAFWWAPTDDGFWLYSIVILTVGIFYLSEKANHLIMIIPILLFVINIPFEIAPASSVKNSVVIQGANVFNRHKFTADDLAITNLIQIRLAYQYYHNIEVRTASLIYSDARNPAEATANIHKILKETLSDGRVFLFENELNPEPHGRFLFEYFSPQDYLQIYKPFYSYMQTVDSIPAYGKSVKIYQLVGLDSLTLDSIANR